MAMGSQQPQLIRTQQISRRAFPTAAPQTLLSPPPVNDSRKQIEGYRLLCTPQQQQLPKSLQLQPDSRPSSAARLDNVNSNARLDSNITTTTDNGPSQTSHSHNTHASSLGRTRLDSTDVSLLSSPLPPSRTRLDNTMGVSSSMLPYSLPNSPLPPSRARLQTTNDSFLNSPLPLRARLGSMESSLPPPRARLNTTETAVTCQVLNSSEGRNNSNSPNPTTLDGTGRISNRHNIQRGANTLDLLDVGNTGNYVGESAAVRHSTSTPIAGNRTPVLRVNSEKRQLLQRLLLKEMEVTEDKDEKQMLQQLMQEQLGDDDNDQQNEKNGDNGDNSMLGMEQAIEHNCFDNDDGSVIFTNDHLEIKGMENHGMDNGRNSPVPEGNNSSLNSIVEQMKILSPAERPDDDEADDSASDLSSLTDAVSYQHQSTPPGAAAAAPSPPAATLIGPVSGFAALSRRWPKKLRKVVTSTRSSNRIGTLDNRDTATTTGTSVGPSIAGHYSIGHYSIGGHQSVGNKTSRTLETIDNSLEQQLFEHGPKRNYAAGSSRTKSGDPASILLPSPLVDMIDRKKMSGNLSSHHRTARTGGSVVSSSHGGSHRRVNTLGSSLTDSNSYLGDGLRHHRRSTSNTSSSNNVGIQSSWLMPSSSGLQQLHSPGAHQLTPMGLHVGGPIPEMPLQQQQQLQPDEDLIDITHDEPIDPFSGLIGMPRSAGCESDASRDGTGSTGWNVFGNVSSSFSLGQSPAEKLGDNVSPGNNDNNSNMPSSMRPPIGNRRSKSAVLVDEFDPLNLEGILESSYSVCSSPLRSPSGVIPSRHHRDDPMLSKSRYRTPSFTPPGQQQQQRRLSLTKKKKGLRHQRSSSLGSGVQGDRMGSMMGNACMFGSIAQLETNKNSPIVVVTTPTSMSHATSCASLEWDGSVGQHSVGQSVMGANIGGYPPSGTFTLETPGSVLSEGLSIGHTPSSQDVAGISPTLDEEEDDDDNSSYDSFSEEYHRPEQKRKIVAKEVKHIIGRVLPMGKPVVKAGRKLLGREKEEAAMKRSKGCLT